MLVVDAQVHIWDAGIPSPHHRQELYSANALLQDMAEAGVDAAVLVPPTWDPKGNQPSIDAAARHPDKFGVMGRIDITRKMCADELREWCTQPGMLGARLSFNQPGTRAALIDGSAGWFWAAAAEIGIPVMLLIPGLLPWVACIAERHPQLKIVIDHLAIPRGAKGQQAFAHLPELLAVARFPNVAIKAAGIPSYGEGEPYPYRSLHPKLEQIVGAFGAERVFWGTDLSRMRCSYRECVTMFTEELDFLSDQERELIMGKGLCQWIGWTLNLAHADEPKATVPVR